MVEEVSNISIAGRAFVPVKTDQLEDYCNIPKDQGGSPGESSIWTDFVMDRV